MNHIPQHRYFVGERKQKGSNAEKDVRSITGRRIRTGIVVFSNNKK